MLLSGVVAALMRACCDPAPARCASPPSVRPHDGRQCGSPDGDARQPASAQTCEGRRKARASIGREQPAPAGVAGPECEFAHSGGVACTHTALVLIHGTAYIATCLPVGPRQPLDQRRGELWQLQRRRHQRRRQRRRKPRRSSPEIMTRDWVQTQSHLFKCGPTRSGRFCVSGATAGPPDPCAARRLGPRVHRHGPAACGTARCAGAWPGAWRCH